MMSVKGGPLKPLGLTMSLSEKGRRSTKSVAAHTKLPIVALKMPSIVESQRPRSEMLKPLKTSYVQRADGNMNNLVKGRSSSQTSIPDCISDGKSAKDPAKPVIKPYVNQVHNAVQNYDLSNYHDKGQRSHPSRLKFQESCKISSVNSSSSSDSSSEHLLSSKQDSVEGGSLSQEQMGNHDSRCGKQFLGDTLSLLMPASDKAVATAEALDLVADADLPVNRIQTENASDKGSLAGGSTETEESTSGRSDVSVESVKKKKKNRKTKKKKRSILTADCSNTRYEIVKQSAINVGFIVSDVEDRDSFLVWHDCAISNERIAELQPYQRINHFPGMVEICRKDNLARNMAKMARAFPDVYNFVPKTWIFPSEYALFQSYIKDRRKRRKRDRTYIVKPPNGAMGNGIVLCKTADRIQLQNPVIVQDYIEKPLLVDGFKCDMRVYVLLTSCDPLHVFLFHDGLLRMGTEKYLLPSDYNLDHFFMHLTNYSINKHSESYERGDAVSTGSKRTLSFLRDYLKRADANWSLLWQNIMQLIIKTLIMAHPYIYHAYRMCRPGQLPGADSVCFEVLGFDILVDRKMKPWLLEINRAPSFGTDEEVDKQIKSAVLEDAFRLLNIRSRNKHRNLAAQKAEAQRRLMRPCFKKGDKPEVEKQRQSLERRREELTNLLYWLKKEEDCEEFERKHCGKYQRIFPPDDCFSKEKYNRLLAGAHRIFLCGNQGQAVHQDILKFYSNSLKDYEIEELLAQCEADEQLLNEPVDNNILPKKQLK